MPAQYALRPVELCDLPTLKRWRSLPQVQTHLRHPHTSWSHHLRWWWRIHAHGDPTCRVWAVVRDGVLVGQAGLYYRKGHAAEVSVLVMDGEQENFAAERMVVEGPLADAAREWRLAVLWAEVLPSAPLDRHSAFPVNSLLCADIRSTVYRWRIA